MQTNFNIRTPRLLRAGLLSIAFASVTPGVIQADALYNHSSSFDVQWVMHPGAHLYNMEQYGVYHKVIDTERYTYVIVRGAMLLMNNEDYWQHLDNIFRFDRQHPEWGLYAVAKDVNMGGSVVELAQYDVRTGSLVILHSNGYITCIRDNGESYICDAYRGYNLPDDNHALAICFDTADGADSFYITTNSGYMQCRLSDGEFVRDVRVGKPVEQIVRNGEVSLAVIGETESSPRRLYRLDAEGRPLDTPLAIDTSVNYGGIAAGGVLEKVLSISPVGENAFVFAREVDAYNYDVALLQIDAEGHSYLAHLQKVGSNLNATGGHAALRRSFPWETESGVWRDGRFFVGNAQLLLLNQNVTPDLAAGATAVADYKAAALKVIPRFTDAGKGAPANFMKTATYDGVRFPYTVSYRGVMQAEYDAARGQWTTDRAVYAPDGPGHTVVGSMQYHPDYGLLARGAGRELDFYGSSSSRDALAAYKDGKWRMVSPFGVDPTQNINAAHLNKIFGQRGVSIDPANTDWVYSNYIENGITRLSLSDPTQPRQWVNDGHSTSAYCMPIFPRGGWASNYSIPTFDADKTMWIAYDYAYEDYESCLDLYYWTAEDRLAWGNGTLGDTSRRPKRIRLQGFGFGNGYRNSQLLAMTHPSNRTKLLYSPNHWTYALTGTEPMIFDHNGTPEDTSDDRVFNLSQLHDIETKAEIFIQKSNFVYEDARSGEAWLSTDRGIYIFNPEEVLSGKPFCRRLKCDVSEVESINATLIENIDVAGIAADPLGRHWIASQGAGVICISADTSKIEAHFTADNSPLPSNEVVSICCTPDGSVFAGTQLGLAEIKLQLAGGGSQAGRVQVSPSNITPDYEGYVRITGLKPMAHYRIEAADGYVEDIVASPEGRCDWAAPQAGGCGTLRLLDADGQELCTFVRL